MTRSELETARAKCEPYLMHKRAGIPCRSFYKVDVDKLDAALELLEYHKFAENLQTRPEESGSKHANQFAENLQTTITKSTPNTKVAGNGAAAPGVSLLTGIPASRQERRWEPTAIQKRLNVLYRRRDGTPWSSKEIRVFKTLGSISEEDLKLVETYYTAQIPKESDYRRRDLGTLLNNFAGEVDRARRFTPQSKKLW